MGLFNQSPSPTEEAFYQRVLEEVESGQMRKGIYAKALADSLGDGGKAQSLYIKYRVQSLIEEQENLGYKLPSKRQQKRIEKEEEEAEAWSNTHWFQKLLINTFSFLFLLFIIYFAGILLYRYVIT